MLKKISFLFIFLSFFLILMRPLPGRAKGFFNTPPTGDYLHSVIVEGSSALSGVPWHAPRFESIGYFSIAYAQPNTFFRMPGRLSLEGSYQKGLTSSYRKYDETVLGLMQNVIIGNPKIYFTLGLGMYIRSNFDDRIGSRFTFGERAGLGTSPVKNMLLEVFVRHFSNGDLQLPNHGQNYVGLSAGILF